MFTELQNKVVQRRVMEKNYSENYGDFLHKLKQPRRETEKGALYKDFDFHAHQFITHLGRVHPSQLSVLM